MSIGIEMAKARKRQGMSQEDLAKQMPVSREALSSYETGRRVFPDDLHKHTAEALDDVEYFFAIWNEAAGDVAIPLLNGEYIDQHPTSLVFLVKKENAEALAQMERACWSKPARSCDENDLREMEESVHELLDAIASMLNLVGAICKAYGFSMKKVFKTWRTRLLVRKYIAPKNQ